ncbi:MAG: beta-glucosidase BglX [Candidatus Cyclobacteriaceae bacterium M3_2C_046]
MKLNKIYPSLFAGLLIFSAWNIAPVTESDHQFTSQVDSILELMTLEEKLGQLNMPAAGDITTGLAENVGIAAKIAEGKVGALLNIQGIDKIHEAQRIAVEESRLGIPLIFAMDVIHGYKTVFPIPLGLSSTWNTEMIEQTARVAAREASAEGISLTFSPMVDVSRDPRWGRIAEGSGEDPFMQSEIARAMVNGYQGDDLTSDHTLMSCVKHFALYGAPVAGRDYNTVDMSRLQMYNVYFPPFKAAVKADVGCVMAAFNDVDAIPATGSEWLMTEVLRNQWGFDGFVVSDYTGINEMTAHGLGDLQAVSELALEAGIDMDMVGEGFLTTLEQSYQEGAVTMEDIDQAVHRVLTAKFKLGLFADPYQYGDEDRSAREVFSAENRQFAREVAAESLVLLKNENDLLPLQPDGKIAVIGPLVDNPENMAGTWSVAADFEKSVSLVQGIKNVAGDQINLLQAKGANIYRDPDLEAKVSIFGKPTDRDSRSPEVLRQEALDIARQSDVIIAALGEAAEMSGESASRSDIGIPEVQLELLKALQETGKPIVLVLFNGRPLTIPWAADNVPAILNAWFPGSEAGHAIADVLFGQVNPSGKLTITFPRNVGQVPIYYAARSTGRPQAGDEFQKFRSNYLDVPNSPLYPFGYGLSYSDFEYSEVKLDKNEVSGSGIVTASVDITNTSDRAGKETVQLYIHDVVAGNTRPNLELKAFEKVMVKPGETVTVSFSITNEMLKYYHYDTESGYRDIVNTWEPGEFEIMIGSSSVDWKKASLVWQE